MDFIDINGKRLEIRHIPSSGGERRAPLVFLHEGLGSVSLWTQRGIDWPAAVCAAAGRAGFVYSRRGYGQSDPVPDVRGAGRLPPDYLHRDAFEVLPALLEAVGIERAVLLGHSDGASIALLHASRFPVSACIAMAPHVFVEDIAVAAITASRLAFENGPLRERLTRHHADVDGAFWQWNDVWLSEAFRSLNLEDDCSRITASLLLIQGENDAYGSMQQLDVIADAARRAERVDQCRLADCGHSPHRDQPALTQQAVVDFLQDIR